MALLESPAAEVNTPRGGDCMEHIAASKGSLFKHSAVLGKCTMRSLVQCCQAASPMVWMPASICRCLRSLECVKGGSPALIWRQGQLAWTGPAITHENRTGSFQKAVSQGRGCKCCAPSLTIGSGSRITPVAKPFWSPCGIDTLCCPLLLGGRIGTRCVAAACSTCDCMVVATLLLLFRHFGDSDCKRSGLSLSCHNMPNFEPQVIEGS